MIYPKNFENKIGFDEIRTMLRERCLSPMGKERVDAMAFSVDVKEVKMLLEQVSEYARLLSEQQDFALGSFFDCRMALQRIRLQGTHLEEDELFDLRRSLDTIISLVEVLNKNDQEDADEPIVEEDGWKKEPKYTYPELHRLTEGIITFPALIQRIDQILDQHGKIRDTASPELNEIRRELARTEGTISKTLYGILRNAQSEGLVEKDVSPTLRDGRLVIPVAPGLKRKIPGIIHDESASGRTVFIEPAVVVEANNRIRELESDERHEIIRILTEFTKQVRPHAMEILFSYHILADVDFIQAKNRLAEKMKAIVPEVQPEPYIDLIRAFHPLLSESLTKQGKQMVPLDITLSSDKHILIISGPNAGGKSVCLKTVGLLQYMLQCGLPIPVGERSKCGIFNDVMIGSSYSSAGKNLASVIDGSANAVVGTVYEGSHTVKMPTKTSLKNAIKIDQVFANVLVISNQTGEILNAVRVKVKESTTGISELNGDDGSAEVTRYSLDGRQLQAPQRGLNLVKMSDGSVRKVLVK